MNKRLKEMLFQKPKRHWTGGKPCSTCSLKAADKINADIAAYAAAKKAGNPMPWSIFYREYVVPEYRYRLDCETLRKHARTCLSLEI